MVWSSNFDPRTWGFSAVFGSLLRERGCGLVHHQLVQDSGAAISHAGASTVLMDF